MQAIVEAVNGWGEVLGHLALTAIWQSTLVALVVGVATWALRRSSPAVRYWLWQIVAIKLLVLPFWTWSVAAPWLPERWFNEPAAAMMSNSPALPSVPTTIAADAGQAEGVAIATSPAPTAAALSWRGGLLMAWAAIVALQVGRLFVQRVRLKHILQSCQPGGEALERVTERVAARLELARAPRVLLGELACSPFVCGLLRPTLVVPRELALNLEAGDLEQIVAHELAHVTRRDLLWGWIPEIARMLYFFHPVAHLASYRVRLERELACDQWAMSDSGRRPAEYAETLVRVLGMVSRPAGLGAAGAALSGEAGSREAGSGPIEA